MAILPQHIHFNDRMKRDPEVRARVNDQIDSRIQSFKKKNPGNDDLFDQLRVALANLEKVNIELGKKPVPKEPENGSTPTLDQLERAQSILRVLQEDRDASWGLYFNSLALVNQFSLRNNLSEKQKKEVGLLIRTINLAVVSIGTPDQLNKDHVEEADLVSKEITTLINTLTKEEKRREIWATLLTSLAVAVGLLAVAGLIAAMVFCPVSAPVIGMAGYSGYAAGIAAVFSWMGLYTFGVSCGAVGIGALAFGIGFLADCFGSSRRLSNSVKEYHGQVSNFMFKKKKPSDQTSPEQPASNASPDASSEKPPTPK